MSVGIQRARVVPVRATDEYLGGFLGTRLDDKLYQDGLIAAMQHIAAEGRGVVVLLGGTETLHDS